MEGLIWFIYIMVSIGCAIEGYRKGYEELEPAAKDVVDHGGCVETAMNGLAISGWTAAIVELLFWPRHIGFIIIRAGWRSVK